MRRPLAIPAVLLLLTGGAATTAPTTSPVPDAPIARWFDDLADPDPAVRDRAREQLMGLSIDALPKLLDVVRAADRLPARDVALHEIVDQAFLAADPYAVRDGEDSADPTTGAHYIMGQSWPFGMRDAGNGLGVPVVNRWPGFPAARFLRDGDLITGIYDDPAAAADRSPDVLTQTTDDLVTAMRQCPTRPRLAMAVLRDGRPIRVTATMVPEPAQTVNRRSAAVAGFLTERQRRADDYWRARFAPVVDPPDAVPPTDSGDGLDR